MIDDKPMIRVYHAKRPDGRRVFYFEPTDLETSQWIRARALSVERYLSVTGAIPVSGAPLPDLEIKRLLDMLPPAQWSGKLKLGDCYATLLALIMQENRTPFRLKWMAEQRRASATLPDIRYRPDGPEDKRFFIVPRE